MGSSTEGRWTVSALQLGAAVPRAHGDLLPSIGIASFLGQILRCLPSPHTYFSEELLKQGGAQEDAEKGEFMQRNVPVLLCVRNLEQNDCVYVV